MSELSFRECELCCCNDKKLPLIYIDIIATTYEKAVYK